MDAKLEPDAIDVTLPGRLKKVAHAHLLQQVSDEIEDIFNRLGYTIAEGPEV
jgi:phenylalanyl-tRNA synthetase alpha chain